MKKRTPAVILPPAPALPSAADYRSRVETAYAEVSRRQGEFIRSVCAFGALLDEVAAFLGEARGGDRKSIAAVGQSDASLQNWLAENCPGVNYKTAMGYKALAMKAARMIGGGTVAIAALQGRDTVAAPGTGDVIYIDNAVIKARDALFEECDSRRKLEQMYFEFASRDRRRKAARPLEPLKTRTAQDNAREIWSRALCMLSHKTVLAAIALLPAKETSVALDAVKEIYEALKDHSKEF